jgi:hypothetical protein
LKMKSLFFRLRICGYTGIANLIAAIIHPVLWRAATAKKVICTVRQKLNNRRLSSRRLISVVISPEFILFPQDCFYFDATCPKHNGSGANNSIKERASKHPCSRARLPAQLPAPPITVIKSFSSWRSRWRLNSKSLRGSREQRSESLYSTCCTQFENRRNAQLSPKRMHGCRGQQISFKLVRHLARVHVCKVPCHVFSMFCDRVTDKKSPFNGKRILGLTRCSAHRLTLSCPVIEA